MLTAYHNNVMQNFGNIWQRTINTLLNCKQRQSELAKQLEAEDKLAPEIKHKCEAQIWGPAQHLKESLGTGQLVAALERTLSAGSYIKSDLKLFEEYLAARADVAERLTRFYNRTICRQQVGAMTPEVSLHRKLQLSAYVNCKRANQLLINRLRKRFTPDAVFVMGNWGTPMTRYHEPIRGKFWQTLLNRGGFTVYLINEHLTLSFCPICEEHISTFLDVPNSRPFRRTSRLMVKCHGLLGCTSQTCVEFEGNYLDEKKDESEGEKKGGVKRRLWNRDLAAVLNFRSILQSLRETGMVPLRFQRKTKTPKTPKTPKAPKAPKAPKTPAAPAPHPS
ncbi:hypothetical protein IW148_002020 [Coemansia sp. RSA 1199]|nr:hypothetical protein IW148_002020 [Coemansia sp. RSA 1199]